MTEDQTCGLRAPGRKVSWWYSAGNELLFSVIFALGCLTPDAVPCAVVASAGMALNLAYSFFAIRPPAKAG